jgi:hypothetical protein
MSEEGIKDQIIVNLQPFSHGSWAHMNINRVALFGRNLKEATSSIRFERFRAALREYIEKVHPAVGKIVQQLHIIQFDPTIVQTIRIHADELAKIAHRLSLNRRQSEDELQRQQSEIPAHADRLLDAFRVMRERMLSEFQCKPTKVLQNILERRKSTDAGKKISFSVRITELDQDAVIPEAEFAKVIEALIDREGDQSDDDAGRELSFVVGTSGERWLLEVHDSSLFVPSHQWGDLSVGRGIPGCAKLAKVSGILGKFDGEICVQSSVEASGTTFLLRLRMLQP